MNPLDVVATLKKSVRDRESDAARCPCDDNGFVFSSHSFPHEMVLNKTDATGSMAYLRVQLNEAARSCANSVRRPRITILSTPWRGLHKVSCRMTLTNSAYVPCPGMGTDCEIPTIEAILT